MATKKIEIELEIEDGYEFDRVFEHELQALNYTGQQSEVHRKYVYFAVKPIEPPLEKASCLSALW